MFSLEQTESSTKIKILNQDLVVIQLLHKEPSKNDKTFEWSLKVTSRRTCGCSKFKERSSSWIRSLHMVLPVSFYMW